MNELNERLWAVVSERGCEASGIDYIEAARLSRELAAKKLSGICIVTEMAAQRLAQAAATRKEAATGNGKPAAKTNSDDSSPSSVSKTHAAARRRKSNKNVS
ncbi:MAG TPA: hypothetical protein VF666_09525 [Pyrinomonadaceae bacterium]